MCDYSAQKRPFVPVCCAYLSTTSNFAPNPTSPLQPKTKKTDLKTKMHSKNNPQNLNPNPRTSLPLSFKSAPYGSSWPVLSSKLNPWPQHSLQRKLQSTPQHKLVDSGLIPQDIGKRTNLSLTFSQSSYGSVQESIVNSFALDAFYQAVKCLALLTQGKVQNSAL